MSLLNEQIAFQRDLRKLFDFIEAAEGYTFTIGEVQRPVEMQEIYVKTGKSKTMESYHLKKLAADVFIFHTANSVYHLVDTKADLQKFGDYWESLSPRNRWGGNWKFYDSPHFERRA